MRTRACALMLAFSGCVAVPAMRAQKYDCTPPRDQSKFTPEQKATARGYQLACESANAAKAKAAASSTQLPKAPQPTTPPPNAQQSKVQPPGPDQAHANHPNADKPGSDQPGSDQPKNQHPKPAQRASRSQATSAAELDSIVLDPPYIRPRNSLNDDLNWLDRQSNACPTLVAQVRTELNNYSTPVRKLAYLRGVRSAVASMGGCD